MSAKYDHYSSNDGCFLWYVGSENQKQPNRQHEGDGNHKSGIQRESSGITNAAAARTAEARMAMTPDFWRLCEVITFIAPAIYGLLKM